VNSYPEALGDLNADPNILVPRKHDRVGNRTISRQINQISDNE
jgi:hypothetical protein